MLRKFVLSQVGVNALIFYLSRTWLLYWYDNYRYKALQMSYDHTQKEGSYHR